MSKAQVNLIKQLRKLLGNVHTDVNNLELQKSFSQLGKLRILSDETEELIKDFIDNTLLKLDRIMFLFRLINFDFQTEINIEDLILIISGKEFLIKLSKDNPKRKIINKDDVLLGISVIGDLNKKSYTVAYTKARRLADFISFINEDSCEVVELRTYQYFNENISGFFQKGKWNLEKVIDDSDDLDALCKLDLNKKFNNRWIPIIKEIINCLYTLSYVLTYQR